MVKDHLCHCSSCEIELRNRTAGEDFWEDTSIYLKSSQLTASEDQLAVPATIVSLLDPTDDPSSLGRLAGYEVTGVIGQGGMGIVLKARDVSLNRFVAIKVLQPNYAGQSASRKRFAREAQAAAAVVHDNVIAIHGVDQWKDLPFLVMPYVKGQSLQQRITADAPLLVDDILRISIQVARGLAAAHDQGLIHRDVKPANVLMPASVSRVILTDFGLARAADDASLTCSGTVAGTPHYMSPEQARGEVLDARSDLFSLGSLMYAMACGRPPFRGESAYGVLRKVTDQDHQPVIEVANEIPMWLSKVIDRLLAKDPKDRFGSADELADYLKDCLAHTQQPTTKTLPLLKPPSKQRQPSKRRARFQRKTLLVVLAFLVLAAVGIGGFMAGGGNDQDGSPTSAAVPPKTRLNWSYDEDALIQLELEIDAIKDGLESR